MYLYFLFFHVQSETIMGNVCYAFMDLQLKPSYFNSLALIVDWSFQCKVATDSYIFNAEVEAIWYSRLVILCQG